MVELALPAKRHLKDSESKQVVKEFTERYPLADQRLKVATKIEELNVEGGSVFFVDEKPLFLRTKSGYLPSLKFDECIGSLPKIVVDMGAVPHVVNGAAIMRPGIRQVKGDFQKDALVVIVDEKFGKALALGVVDMDSEAIRSASKGKVVANVHYVGDEFWNSFPATP